MEKRWCERVPVSIDVEIQHKGNKVGNCKVKDISLRGICLSSGPLGFYINTTLKIKFPDNIYSNGNTDKINAIVVRNSRYELGLIFDPADQGLTNSIVVHQQFSGMEMAFAYSM